MLITKKDVINICKVKFSSFFKKDPPLWKNVYRMVFLVISPSHLVILLLNQNDERDTKLILILNQYYM